MNLQTVKQDILHVGLKSRAQGFISVIDKPLAENNYPEALENAKTLVALLQELVSITKERKPRSDKGQPRFNKRKKKTNDTQEMFPLPVDDKIVNVPVSPAETRKAVEKLGKKQEDKMPF